MSHFMIHVGRKPQSERAGKSGVGIALGSIIGKGPPVSPPLPAPIEPLV